MIIRHLDGKPHGAVNVTYPKYRLFQPQNLEISLPKAQFKNLHPTFISQGPFIIGKEKE